jgi:23S rRNA (cytidine1920-2'-O)/16S rRNA (cytidine1409-2'-O)-methyltransferase
MKTRLDKLLLARGLVPSRERAQALILAGKVLVNEQKVEKPGTSIEENASIRLLGEDLRYVSRGGLKLEGALQHWKIDIAGKTCLDVGASTGGFTQVLLERGAAKIYAVDVGHGQLHASLRARPEIISMEGIDVRTLSPARLGDRPDLVTIDVSFVSLKLALPPALALAKLHAQLVALIKPQFEAGRAAVKKGVVRDKQIHAAVCDDIAAFVAALGWRVADVMPSPITGGDGNAEFLLGAEH